MRLKAQLLDHLASATALDWAAFNTATNRAETAPLDTCTLVNRFKSVLRDQHSQCFVTPSQSSLGSDCFSEDRSSTGDVLFWGLGFIAALIIMLV
jgi:hypothetical protein